MKNLALSLSISLLFTFWSYADKASTSRDITVAEAAKILAENPDVVVLDIRTPEEYSDGHIEGALLIDYFDDAFDSEIDKLDRDKVYVMHCASGGRSGKAVKKFSDKGFRNILHLKPGFKGWKKAGQPVAK